MTARLLRFVPAMTLAACTLAPDPDSSSEPTAGEESAPPPGFNSARYTVVVTTQPDGQGDLVYAVRGYRIPQQDAGTVVITFPSGSELRHEYEVQGDVQRISRGQQVQMRELVHHGRDPFRNHVVAVSLAVHRHYRELQARADAELLYGMDDRVAVARQMNVDLHRDSSAVGYCGAEIRYEPIDGVTMERCEPERPPAPDVIADCYGATHGQDFECSAGVPEVVFLDGQPVDLRTCCLEHDRAFWCGGTALDGTVPFGGAGSFMAWEEANEAIADCFVAAANEALRNARGDAGPVDEEGTEEGLGFLEDVGRWIWDLANAGMFPAAGAGFFNVEQGHGESDENWAARQQARMRLIAERQSSCLCGGDRVVPRCGTSGCFLNDCSLPAPAVLEWSAFVWSPERCGTSECQWVCEEHTQDGQPIFRQLRTYRYNFNGIGGHYEDCTPDYDFTCECEPLRIVQEREVCEITFADLDHHLHDISLPTGGSNDGLIPLPPDARFAPPPISKPPYIAPRQ